MHKEIANLREGYRIISDRYNNALTLISNHAEQSEQAAMRISEQVEKAAEKARDATDLAARTVEIAAALAKEKAEERGRVLLESVKLYADVSEALNTQIEATAQDAKAAQRGAALTVKLAADAAKDVAADAAATEAAILKR